MKPLIPFIAFCAALVLLHSALYLYFYIRGKRRKVVPGVFYQVRYNAILDRFTLNDVPMEKSQKYEVMIPAADFGVVVLSVRPESSLVFGWHFVFTSNFVRLPFKPVGLFCRIPSVPEVDENGDELGGGYEF